MKIRIIDHSGKSYMDHPGFGPWYTFEEQLKSQGHEILKGNINSQADVNIMNCYSKKIFKKINISKEIQINILIIWEPEVTNSRLYKKRYLKQFSLVYCPSPKWAEKVNGKNFNWPAIPLFTDPLINSLWLERENNAVMILSNKFSSHRLEMYSLRRKLATSSGDGFLNVFGSGWKKSFFMNIYEWIKSIRRVNLKDFKLSTLYPIKSKKWNKLLETSEKYETLRRHRISVVIENSSDYISEKIFDSLYSQNIVIYVGPSLSDFNLSEDLVISTTNNLDILKRKINEIIGLSGLQQLEILNKQQRLYQSECFKWNNDRVMKELAIQINSDLKQL
jgi:hypothetical protein